MSCAFRAALAVALTLGVSPAFAQTASTPSLRDGRFTLSGGLNWTGSYPIGDALASLRSNATGATPPPFTLFRAETSVDATAGVELRLGYALTRSFVIEGGATFSRPRLTASLSEDHEAAPATIEAEELSQVVIDAGVVWHLPRAVGRLRPFLTGGGGYLRQLYDERTIVETGSVVYAGAGVRYFLRGGDGVRRSVGIRGDLRAQWRIDGVEFEDRTRLAPVVSVLLFWEP